MKATFNTLIAFALGVLAILVKELFLFLFFLSSHLSYSVITIFDGAHFLHLIYPLLVFLSTVVLINESIFCKVTALTFNLVLIILFLLRIPPIKDNLTLLIAFIISALIVFFILSGFRTNFRKRQENDKLLSIFGIAAFVIYITHNVFGIASSQMVIAYLFFSLLVPTIAILIAFKKGIGYSFVFYMVTLFSVFLDRSISLLY